jgi:hypothetical protein
MPDAGQWLGLRLDPIYVQPSIGKNSRQSVNRQIEPIMLREDIDLSANPRDFTSPYVFPRVLDPVFKQSRAGLETQQPAPAPPPIVIIDSQSGDRNWQFQPLIQELPSDATVEQPRVLAPE